MANQKACDAIASGSNDPQVARFISEDPIGFGGGINSYEYVGNSPLAFTDPLGLAKCKDPKYCRNLLNDIISKTNRFFNDFRPYKDSGFTDRGGKPWSHGGKSGVSGPGGHYNQLVNGQRGLVRDILDYIQNCLDKGDPPPPDLRRALTRPRLPSRGPPIYQPWKNCAYRRNRTVKWNDSGKKFS